MSKIAKFPEPVELPQDSLQKRLERLEQEKLYYLGVIEGWKQSHDYLWEKLRENND